MVAWEVNACVEHSIDNEYFEKLYGETDENFKLQISPNALTLFLNNNKQTQIHFSVYSSILVSRNRIYTRNQKYSQLYLECCKLEFYRRKLQKLLRHKQRNLQLNVAKCRSLQHPNYILFEMVNSLIWIICCYNTVTYVLVPQNSKHICSSRVIWIKIGSVSIFINFNCLQCLTL